MGAKGARGAKSALGILLALILVALHSFDVDAQERWQLLVREWLAAVNTHVAGEDDEAARSIGAWTRSDLGLVLPYIEALTNIGADLDMKSGRTAKRVNAAESAHLRELATIARGHGEAHRLALRGAFLHTDIVTIVQRDPAVVAAPKPRRLQSLLEREETTPRILARVPDGRLDTFELGPLHWDFARQLLTSVDPASPRGAVVRLWYRAVAAYFASVKNFGEGRPHLDHALRLFPKDAGLLLESGSLQEAMASPAVQEFVRTTTLPNQLRILDIESTATHLVRAERQLRRSVEIDAASAEARLRLGRVLGLSQRHAEAAIELSRAANEATEPVVRFYANLFLGDEELTLDRADRAIAAFTRALEQFPDAQSARLALSHVTRHGGERAAAFAILQPTLAATQSDVVERDAWRAYFLGGARYVDRLFEELYAPFRAEPRQ